MNKLTNEQAISVLITGCRIGQSKGAYSLEDSATILSAIHFLQPKQEVKEEVEAEKYYQTNEEKAEDLDSNSGK